MGGDSQKMEKEREAALRECEKLRAAMKKLGFDDATASGLLQVRSSFPRFEGMHARCWRVRLLVQERKDADRKITELRERVADLTARFSHVQLDYRDPMPNFDRARVKGLVINLLKVKEPRTTTALEVAAGGRLYNVSSPLLFPAVLL
jgi:chromosome segregation ATPase